MPIYGQATPSGFLPLSPAYGNRDSLDFNLWLVVPLHDLALEVLKAHGGCQGGPHGVQVWLECR